MGGVLALVGAFGLGRLSAEPSAPLPLFSWNAPASVSFIQSQPADPRELIPLPMPGQPDEQEQSMPGQQGQEQCPLYFFQDGQFFQLRPGEGQQGPLGQGNPELFPLDPVPRPPSPAPGPQPNPRQPEQPPERPGSEPGPEEPEAPFFRAPGVASAPLPAPQLVSAPFRLDISMAVLPGR